MALNAVDSTGVSEDVAHQVEEWQRWLDDENSNFTPEQFVLRIDMAVTRRDAEYVVECLRLFLPLGRIGNKNPRNTLLSLEESSDRPLASDEGTISVFSTFLQQPETTLVSLRFEKLYRFSTRFHLYRSLHTNTSVKELEIDRFLFHDRQLSNMLQQKNDLTALRLYNWTFFAPEDVRLTLSQGMPYLRELVLSHSFFNDEGFGWILEAISRGDFPVLEDMDFSFNKITHVGLGYLWTRLGPAARRRLRKLNLQCNWGMLDDLESTHFFVQNILLSHDMNLKELNISRSGKHTPPIIKACENDKNKLQKLDIHLNANLQAICDQLIESWPKMKWLTHLVCASNVFDLENRLTMLKALRKNASIVEHTLVDGSDDDDYDETRLLIADIMKRNQILKHADALLALQPTTGMPIRSKSGLWYKAFAQMALPSSNNDNNDDTVVNHDGEYPGASAIFKILQQRPALWEKL